MLDLSGSRKLLTEADMWSLLMKHFTAVTCHYWCVTCLSIVCYFSFMFDTFHKGIVGNRSLTYVQAVSQINQILLLNFFCNYRLINCITTLPYCHLLNDQLLKLLTNSYHHHWLVTSVCWGETSKYFKFEPNAIICRFTQSCLKLISGQDNSQYITVPKQQ